MVTSSFFFRYSARELRLVGYFNRIQPQDKTTWKEAAIKRHGIVDQPLAVRLLQLKR